jgi:signal peptidase I
VTSDAAVADAAASPPRSGRRVAAWAVVVVLAVLAVRGLLVQSFVVPTSSMEPTLRPGDRVLVWRPSGLLHQVSRGDVVVFDGGGVLAPEAPPARTPLAQLGRAVAAAVGSPVGSHDLVKRVIGLPGDRVRCCVDGRVTVNGTPLEEPYLAPGVAASDIAFDQVVPAGRLWVMGDNRPDSSDSRDHLGDPGGGMVPVSRVVGRVVTVWWPLDRTARVSSQDQEATP